MEILGIIVIWSAMAFVGVLVARSRGRDAAGGCLLGALLGPIGWLILALMPKGEEGAPPSTVPDAAEHRRPCPYCAEQILYEATVCKHCGRDVEPKQPEPEPPKLQCRNCGYPVSSGTTKCPQCWLPYPLREEEG